MPWKLIPIPNDPTGEEGASELVQQVRAATRELYERRGYVPPWTCYLAVDDAGHAIGTCGFVGPPANGEVEVAYFTFPGGEGRGLATWMAGELVAIAAETLSDTASVIAHTLPGEGASTRILRKHGFTCLGPFMHPTDGEVWKWRRASSPLPRDGAI